MDKLPPWYAPAFVLWLACSASALADGAPPPGPSHAAARPVLPRVAAFVHRAAVAAVHVVHPHPRPATPVDAQPVPPPPPPPAVTPQHDDAERARNAGVLDGQVVSVDYQRGMIGLQTVDRGLIDVMILPSTNIQGHGDSFHTIADIARGSRLRVFLSQRAGQLFAQIIHLR
jgi:hypothetical protein